METQQRMGTENFKDNSNHTKANRRIKHRKMDIAVCFQKNSSQIDFQGIDKQPCHFFDRHGYCKFGKTCRFAHISKPSTQPSQTKLNVHACEFEPHNHKNRYELLPAETDSVDNNSCNDLWKKISKDVTIAPCSDTTPKKGWVRGKRLVVIYRDFTKLRQMPVIVP